MPDPFTATAATNNLGVGGRISGLIRASYSNVTTGNHAVFSADEILARDRSKNGDMGSGRGPRRVNERYGLVTTAAFPFAVGFSIEPS